MYKPRNDTLSVLQNFEIHITRPHDIVSILALYHHNKERLREQNNVEGLLIASPRSNNATQDTHF